MVVVVGGGDATVIYIYVFLVGGCGNSTAAYTYAYVLDVVVKMGMLVRAGSDCDGYYGAVAGV